MKQTTLLILLALLCSVQAFSQTETKLGLTVSATSYKYDGFQSYMELSYAFSRSGVAFQKYESGYLGNVSMHTVLTPEGKDPDPIAKSWTVPVYVKDTAGLSDLRMIGLVDFVLDPGEYTMYIAARDENDPAVSDTMTVALTVRKYGTMTTEFSDIQLASSIKKIEKDTNNIFYKNTLEVIPNPSVLYGKQTPVVYYYAELYNYTGSTYGLTYEVVSSYGKTILTKDYKRPGVQPAAVEIGAINITTLPSGVYTLNLTCKDTDGEVETAQSAHFYIYNPDVPIDTMAVRSAYGNIGQEFAMLTEEELNDRFAQALYIAESEERQVWDELQGSEAKKKFLTKFWERRDRDRSTPVNEYYMDYQSRVAFATTEFRSAYMPGWKSDRGRVFIIYGAPDGIERDNSGMDTAPYEVWYYDGIEGGVGFVFVDRRNMGLYDLMHSTKQGETQDPSYDYLIR